MSANNHLSKPGSGGMQRYLDRAEVLAAVVAQLRKDLAQAEQDFPAPPVGEEAFEQLRAQVRPVLAERLGQGMHDLQMAMYRVDIPEAHLKRTLAAGGLDALAGECVLRALQKVLTRLRFAGRY